MSHTLFLGVGNTLLTDEGAGVHVMQHLRRQAEWDDNVEFLDAGTLSFVLADAIAQATNLIILDAAQIGGTPGCVKTFEGSDFDDFLLGGRRSVHEVGFADLMDIARLQDCLPEKRALIGIQPGDCGWGEVPGEAVSKAIPHAAALATDILARWQAEPPQEVVNQ